VQIDKPRRDDHPFDIHQPLAARHGGPAAALRASDDLEDAAATHDDVG